MHERKEIFQKLNCPVCNSNSFSVKYSSIWHFTKEFEIMGLPDSFNLQKSDVVICSKCHHSFLNPVISEQILNKYYSELDSVYYNKIIDPAKQMKHLADRHNQVLKIISKYAKSNCKILEIGSGYGFLLKKLQDFGFDTTGIEPSPHAFKYSSEVLNLNIIQSFLNDNSFSENEFDFILLFDVVEHIYNLSSIMGIIKKIMKPDGYVIFGTGNIDSLYAKFSGKNWFYFSFWEHVSFFSPKSVKFLANKYNLELTDLYHTSYTGNFFISIIGFIKGVIKRIFINPFLNEKHKYKINLFFDHMIVVLKNAE